jgi:hypothetical protein
VSAVDDPRPKESDAAFEPKLDFGARLGDRLNPIVVREIQQATSSRGLIALLGLSLLAVLFIAQVFAGQRNPDEDLGAEVFGLAVGAMTILSVFIMPMLAFQSMRQEVQAGLGDQLALTKLGPVGIVYGKTVAALAQFALVLSLFAPLLATSYLLRGIDVVTIATGMAVVTVLCVVCTLIAIAASALAKTRMLQSLAQVGILVGFFYFGVGMVMTSTRGSPFTALVRADLDEIALLGFWTAMAALAAGMAATAALTHAYENRSSRFRILALFGAAALPPTFRVFSNSTFEGAALAAFFAIPFWLVACTESETMSPRVRARVPLRGTLAWVVLLPGGSRGLLFTVLLAIVALWSAAACETPGRSNEDARLVAITAWSFTAFYAGIALAIRRMFRDTPHGSQQARLVCVIAFVLFFLGTAFLTVAAGPRDWDPITGLNPVFTLAEVERRGGAAFVFAQALGAFGFLGSLVVAPAAFRGVLAAAKERRGGGRPAEESVAGESGYEQGDEQDDEQGDEVPGDARSADERAPGANA